MTTVESPIGPLTLVAEDGVLCGLYMAEQRHAPPGLDLARPDPAAFAAATVQLAAYFDGELTRFELPITLAGTPFQEQVWATLREIPYGRTISYGELAARIGRPSAARAVGLANGRNPISIIVPCHRVIGAGGRLTGYGGGLPRKEQLLALEQRVTRAAGSAQAGEASADTTSGAAATARPPRPPTTLATTAMGRSAEPRR